MPLVSLSFLFPSGRCRGACPAQVNTAPLNTRGDDWSPQQRCDAAAGRERRDKSGGSSARLFMIGDRLLGLIRLKKIPKIRLKTLSFIRYCVFIFYYVIDTQR